MQIETKERKKERKKESKQNGFIIKYKI
jgi:hypothetical protein